MSQTTVKSEPVKRPTARKDMTKLQWTLKEMRKNYLGYVLLAPYYIIFLLFTVLPVIMSLIVSFTDFNMLEWPNFVFLDNYISLFLHDEIFLIALKNTLMFAVVVGPGGYMLSLFLAWFINELSPKTRAIVTLIFYAPSISGGVYTVWKTLFSSDSYGWLNAALIRLGFISSPIAWFGKSELYHAAMYAGIAVDVARTFLPFLYRRFADGAEKPVRGCRGGRHPEQMAGTVVYHAAVYEATAHVRCDHVYHWFFWLWRHGIAVGRKSAGGLRRLDAVAPLGRLWINAYGNGLCVSYSYDSVPNHAGGEYGGTEIVGKGRAVI